MMTHAKLNNLGWGRDQIIQMPEERWNYLTSPAMDYMYANFFKGKNFYKLIFDSLMILDHR